MYSQFCKETNTTPNEQDFNYALALETEVLGDPDLALKVLTKAANSTVPVTPYNILYMRPAYMWAIALKESV